VTHVFCQANSCTDTNNQTRNDQQYTKSTTGTKTENNEKLTLK